MKKKGVLILIIGPSGTGKGTTIEILKKAHPDWIFPISATTRPRRPREKDGQTYHFFSDAEFKAKLKNNEFLEHAIVHDDYLYGTLKSGILPFLEQGKIVLREVDAQGFISISQKIPKTNILSFFLLPPSKEILIKRITARSPMTADVIAKRMKSLEKEIKIADKCDVKIENKNGNLNFAAKVIEKALKNYI